MKPTFTLLVAALFSLFANSAFAQLSAYWSFDDASDAAQAVDAVSGLTGSLEGGAAYSADAGGFSGSAGDYSLVFGQSEERNEHVLVDGSFVSSLAADDQLTVSFWQKLDATPNSSAFFAVSPSSSGNERGAQAHVPWSNGQIFFDTAGCCAGGSQRVNGAVDVDYAVWNHFAFVKNGESKEVYVNGELMLSSEGANPLPTDFTSFVIGNTGTGEGLSPVGVIDDFAIFGNSLSAGAIGRLAGGQSPQSVPETARLALLLCGAIVGLRFRARR